VPSISLHSSQTLYSTKFCFQ